MYVNELKIKTNANYDIQTNAHGDSVVDYINKKRIIEVGIIPLHKQSMIALKQAIDNFRVNVSFLNPLTGTIEIGVSCIIPQDEIEYYTIWADDTMFKAFKLQFIEL